ncbi:TonB-dependent siderophore receptor [Erythrobacter sp. HL-111]|uniref:TonB-dependent receptor plug domain-containing protein n=1 Tax=Erythrobacter sp. HL-111 TaxID=1798193 RepID=UPI0006DB44F1|nr:TonB-dependent receptor [Erythrobacter sp. HL-111]KPP94429.1 MAG: TonB-dependent cobalamin receptor BtuB [Erythrobacteraceae bacterium HL-111]SDS56421.1 vitamin B12 transporter [Erythrobacter sp. HL-111]
MNITVRLCAAVSALALLPAPGLAQQALDRQGGEDPGDEEIIVTANRSARAKSQVGESVTVIGEEEIVTRQPSEVLDILRTVPGVTFNRNGGIGTVAGVSIRGAQADQTVVLVDGIKLNDPASTGGGFDFGALLVGNISRVEVVRGSQSVLYGSQAIGGVVNLLTREPSEEIETFARAEYGARDTAELVGNVSGRFGPVAASVGATWFRTDGISAFSEARGGTERDGFESLGVNGKLDIAITDTVSLDLRAFYADAETGVDGFPAPAFALADTDELSLRQDFVGYAGINAAFLDGRFRNRLGFAYTDIDRRNLDLSGGNETETFDANGRNRRFEYQGVFDATGFANLVFGAEREESELRSSSRGAPATRADVWINSVYGQVNLTPLDGLSLTGGVRYDDHETFGEATTFQASGAYSPNAGSTVVRASYGEGFKAPSLFQLFSDFGNPGLDAEESEAWDAGITQAFLDGRAEIGVTYFEREATNEIVFVGCFENPLPPCQVPTPPFGTYDNIARARADGWEFGLALRPVDGFDVAVNYSIIDAFDETTGNRLPRRAEETVSLVADYRMENGLGIGTTIFVAGDSFDNAANTTRLDGYVVADLRVSYGITESLELFGRIENVTDEQYETIFLYGQPGRGVFGGVRYRM